MTWVAVVFVFTGGFATGSLVRIFRDGILNAPISDDTSSGLPTPECDCLYCNEEDQMPQVNDAQLAAFYAEGNNQDVLNN